MKLSSGCYKRLQTHKRRMQNNMDSSMEKSSRYIVYQFFEMHLLKYLRKKKARITMISKNFYIKILLYIIIRTNFSKFLHCVIHYIIIIIIKRSFFFLIFSFFSSCNLSSISSLVLQLLTKKSLSRKFFCTP